MQDHAKRIRRLQQRRFKSKEFEISGSYEAVQLGRLDRGLRDRQARAFT